MPDKDHCSLMVLNTHLILNHLANSNVFRNWTPKIYPVRLSACPCHSALMLDKVLFTLLVYSPDDSVLCAII